MVSKGYGNGSFVINLRQNIPSSLWIRSRPDNGESKANIDTFTLALFGKASAFATSRRKTQTYMDRFSIVVLGSTLELATDAMPRDHHPRVADCVKIIRECIDSPYSHDENELGRVVIELADLARQNHEFLISARLRDFARQLGGRREKSDVA